MRNSNSKWVLILLIFSFTNVTFSQDNEYDPYQIKDRDSSFFVLSIGFINDAVFLGRKDSISAPYLYPSITYYNKSGFYTTGSFSYLTKSSESRIDLFLGTIGYDFTIKKFNGDISITKYFFNTESYNVISEVEADVTASFSYDFKVINLVASATSFFSSDSNTDIFLSSEISHDFVTKNQKIQISPTVGIYLGSQNFYEEYYINTRFGGGGGKGSGPSTGQGTGGTTQSMVKISESEIFGLMAFEFSLPVWYVHKPVAIRFLPVYVIPQNPATLTTEDAIYEEDLESIFYWLIGASYTF